MKKVLLTKVLLLMAVLFTGVSFAQTVSGTVSEENGPLPGASVVVKGTTNGASTDFDGNFTLNNVPSDATLVVSYIGFSTKEVAVNGKSTINITLATDNALEEVVLIGYGSTTVKDATGSVTAVTSEDFNQGVIASPEQLIQGKTAGVQISESSGEPGAGISVRIRGVNSIRSGNDPLYVIDGVPLGGGGAPASADLGGLGGGSQRNPLSFINPTDIESINILKDASATAIYGARGANGVIIVKTKGGRGASKGKLEINSSLSYAQANRRYNLFDGPSYLAVQEFLIGDNAADLDFGSNTDWQDFYTREVLSRRTDLSYSKSYEDGNLRVSTAYSNQNGVIRKTAQERITGRINAQHRFFDDKLTLDLQGTISRVNDTNAPISGQAGSTGDFIGASITANPTWPIDPNFNPGSNLLNPANLIANYLGESHTNRYLGNLSASYKFNDNFSGKVTAGYDFSDATTTAIFAPSVLGLNQTSGVGQGGIGTLENTNTLLEATVNYTKDFDKSNIDIIAGYAYQKFDRVGYNAQARGFGSNDLDILKDDMINTLESLEGAVPNDAFQFGYDASNTFFQTIDFANNTFAVNPITNGFNRTAQVFVAQKFDNADEFQSFFVRGNYTYADKFLVTATFRADGSTQFGSGETYGFFPSAAVAYKLHEEDFVSDKFSTLKLRVGAGQVGNSSGLGYGNAIFRQTIGTVEIDSDNTLNDALNQTATAGNNNADLKWETTLDISAGVDFGINDDRLSGALSVYRKETSDLLLQSEVAAPGVPGQATFFRNLNDGIVLNTGLELELNYDWIDTEDWGFTTSFNIAYNDNEVQDTQLVIPSGPINGNGLTGAFAQQLSAGRPLFSYYMAEFTGFDEEGFPTYTDVDGDGVGDPDADKKFIGKDAIADWTGGLSLNLRYRNFDLSAYFNGQFDFYVYNATDNAFFTAGGLAIAKNTTVDALISGENGAASTAVSTRFLEKGDFVRLQTLSLGWNYPLSKEGLFDSLRFTLTGQNLFIFTEYSGLDPEISANTGNLNASSIPTAGIDYAAFPRPTTVTLGLNARF